MIESREIADLVFERLPVFSATCHLYYPGATQAADHATPLLSLLDSGSTRLDSRLSRDEASLVRVLRFVEQIHEEGSSGAVGLVASHFLEVFAGGLNDLAVDWAQIEALAGPRTAESVDLFRGLGLWETFRLPRALSELLR